MQADPFLPNSLAGWLSIVAQFVATAIAAGTIVWKVLKDKLDSMVAKEKADRELADSRIEARVVDNTAKVNEYVGKTDMLKDRFHEDEKSRLAEIGALRLEIEKGFNQLRQLLLDQLRREEKRRYDPGT